MPGASACLSVVVPYLRSALDHVAGVPGTPAERPLKRASLKLSGLAFSKNESGRIVAGDFSRPSIVVTLPCGVRMTMNPPPPMPQLNGSTTPSTPAAATAPSTALPPCARLSTAAFVARTSTLAAAPPVPRATGVLGRSCAPAPCAPASRAISAASSSATARGCRLIGPPEWSLRTALPPRRRCQPPFVLARDAQQRGLERLALVLAQARHERAVGG